MLFTMLGTLPPEAVRNIIYGVVMIGAIVAF